MIDRATYLKAAAETEAFVRGQVETIGPHEAMTILTMALGFSVGNAAATLKDASRAGETVGRMIRDVAINRFLERGRVHG